MMGLNTETKDDDGSERRNLEAMMALNAKTKNDDGFECRN